MKERHRPGSWSVLIVTMALTMALVKLAKRLPSVVAPLSVFIAFITEKYGEEIDQLGKRIKRWLLSLWGLIGGTYART